MKRLSFAFLLLAAILSIPCFVPVTNGDDSNASVNTTAQVQAEKPAAETQTPPAQKTIGEMTKWEFMAVLFEYGCLACLILAVCSLFLFYNCKQDCEEKSVRLLLDAPLAATFFGGFILNGLAWLALSLFAS